MLYLDISHRDVNVVSPLRHKFHMPSVIDKDVDQWRTRLCMYALRLKAIILNVCYRRLLISVNSVVI